MAFLPVSPDVSQKGNEERWGCKAIRSLTSTVDAALLSDHHFAPPDFILKVYSSDYCFSDYIIRSDLFAIRFPGLRTLLSSRRLSIVIG